MIDEATRTELCKEFKVNPDQCGDYEVFYQTVLLKKVQKKYLSHLVSSVEELINKKRLAKNNESPAETDKKNDSAALNDKIAQLGKFSILLCALNIAKAKTYEFEAGVIIAYNENSVDSDKRILIAHELGHILNINHSDFTDTQNTANIFTFFAINGKNEFYKNKASELIFRSESEIISKISALCPITQSNQKSKIR
ncbi:MAG: ImmA/IrrE family metallo-endopeptidase [Spirochaetaceae bacterium]|nr:ImmA/IrrE family metallo-endopeptidase [Spirochaetaceae bacterium]